MDGKPLVITLDLEGVLIPEIWIAVAEKTGIERLRLTTRDIADYDELMRGRLQVLRENDLRLSDIREVIGTLEPLTGAQDFLNWARENYEVIILSDTYYEFAGPLMRKLGYPTLFCNMLEVDDEGRIIAYKLRQKDGKRHAVEALRSLQFTILAAGDSFNDTTMLEAAHYGILFRASEKVKQQFPQYPSTKAYSELQELISEFDKSRQG